MGYYIDLETISIDQYKEMLKSADLIPSWMILKEDIDKNLNAIKKQNIHDLDELHKALGSKAKLVQLSIRSGLPQDYLSVLRRVINGYQPKANRIEDFPNVTEDLAAKLEALGIKTTLQLYDEILTADKRTQLSSRTGLSENEIMKLAKLTDLSRIRWVNHTFAYVLMEAGYDTSETVANADYAEMYKAIRTLNSQRGIYKGNIGERDIKRCVEAARSLAFEIQY